MGTSRGLDSLGLYALSMILSFLSETEGTSLLLTQRRYCARILPMFRKRFPKNGLIVINSSKKQKNCHKFVVCPVQDPNVLLERLNTKRLRKRSETFNMNMTTVQLAEWEWKRLNGQIPPPLELLRFEKCKETTLLTSYPRSGNTLLRTLLERTTGQVTGSDTRPNRTLSKSLALEHNLVGEGVLESMVVKTHFPERVGYQKFQANRAILLVRNPYDAIDSYWNLCLTNTHTESVTDEVYQRLSSKFEGLVRNEINVWLKFHRYWLNAGVPILVVRFEDLIVNPESEMCRVMEFVSDESSLSEFWRQRIRHACGDKESTTADKLGSYRPRSAMGKAAIGKSILKGRYSKELMYYFDTSAEQEESNGSLLQLFGYSAQKQHFPTNFINGDAPSIFLPRNNATKEHVLVNAGTELRYSNDPYGRAMTPWRKSLTQNDANPFPTVSRNHR